MVTEDQIKRLEKRAETQHIISVKGEDTLESAVRLMEEDEARKRAFKARGNKPLVQTADSPRDLRYIAFYDWLSGGCLAEKYNSGVQD